MFVTKRLPSLTLDIALQFQMYVYVLEQRNSLCKLEKIYSNFKNQYEIEKGGDNVMWYISRAWKATDKNTMLA